MIQISVTGATGLLGRHLVETLLVAGVKVRAFVRPSSDVRELQVRGIELVEGDAQDQRAVEKAVEKADFVFHLAGYLTADAPFNTTGNTSGEDWPLYQRNNVDFTTALLQASLAAGVRRFVYVSSSSVYSLASAVPTPEDAPLEPFSLYGRSKLLAEDQVRAFQERGLQTTIVRPSVAYGSGDRYFTPMALRLARMPILPLISGGRTLLDLVYARDVADLLWCAAQNEAAIGQTYNAGPGRPTTLYDLIQAYRQITGSAPYILTLPRWLAMRTAWLSRNLVKPFFPEAGQALTPDGLDLMSRDMHLDMHKAAAELGFHPRFDLVQGLALTLAAEELPGNDVVVPAPRR